MKIVTVQIAAQLGQLETNIEKTDKLLEGLTPDDVDFLVLPELAFSGYNFASLAAITPHLEPTAAGPTATWAKHTAQRLNCVVVAGYPERALSALDANVPRDDTHNPRRYNASLTVAPGGRLLAHYRKSFLYYTDETWADEGNGFYVGTLPLPSLGRSTGAVTDGVQTDGYASACRVAHGICMDINPYRFCAPWDAYEFANHALRQEARLVVLSNAWLMAPPSAVDAPVVEEDEGEDEVAAGQPHVHTLSYWIERFRPLVEREDGEVVVVCANRTGMEGTAKYAGTSTVMRLGRGEVALWDVLGMGTEGLLRVDTSEDPLLRLVSSTKKHGGAGEED